MLGTATAKPTKGTHARTKARGKREQAKADKAVYAAVDARDGHRCCICGLYCGASIHRHHVVYRSQGGVTTLDNLRSVCPQCHACIHAKRIAVTW